MLNSSIKPRGRFGMAILLQLERKELTIKAFSEVMGFSYEETRRLIQGSALPQDGLVKKMCSALELDYDRMLLYVAQDRAESPIPPIL